MENKLIVCGLNGSGKSTLGKALAEKLGWKFMDIEAYYFPEKNADYSAAAARTKAEVTELLLEDMAKHPKFVLAAVKGNFGEQVMSKFTCAVLITVPKEIRMKRVRDRAHRQFGDRILPGGDLYEQEEGFFDMAAKRSEKEVEDWLKNMEIPVIRVDGTRAIEKSVDEIIEQMGRCCMRQGEKCNE